MYALIDCNNFFASCERVFNPKLEGRAMVVLSNNDGCVISRSNESKKLGIKMGAPFFKCEDIIKKHNVAVYSTNFVLYGDMSARVMDTLALLVPEMEVYSIDEAFLSFEGITHDHTLYGKFLRKRVGDWTGLPISVGIAPTKTLAKAAADISKKNSQFEGVVNLGHTKDVDAFLETLPLDEVWGIGRGYAERFYKKGMKTTRDVKYAPLDWVRSAIGITGVVTVRELNGIPCVGMDEGPPAKQSITCSRSFGKPKETFNELRESVARYTARVAEKLREQKTVARVLQVYIRTSAYGDGRYSNSLTIELKEPTSYTPALLDAATGALRRIYKDGCEYKKAGVTALDILPEDKVQLNLFKKQNYSSKKRTLMHTLDHINARWGGDTVHYASEGTHTMWGSGRKNISKRFTTHWDELLTVRS